MRWNKHIPRKLLAIALVMLWCIMTSFTYWGMYRRLEQWRAWRWEKLDRGDFDHQLTCLVFTLEQWRELPKYEGGKEMRWNQAMYDIAHVHTEGNRVVVKALLDDQEDKLNEVLRECEDAPRQVPGQLVWWNVFAGKACVDSLSMHCVYAPAPSKVIQDYLLELNAQNHLAVPHEPPCMMS